MNDMYNIVDFKYALLYGFAKIYNFVHIMH